MVASLYYDHPCCFCRGLRMMLLLGDVYEYYPWEEYTRLIVLLVSIVLIVSSLFIVATAMHINESFRYIRRRHP